VISRPAQLAAIVFAFVLGAAFAASAQFDKVNPVREPRVMSGPDIGFRITGLRGSTPVGDLVVKVNGEWVTAEIRPTPNVVR